MDLKERIDRENGASRVPQQVCARVLQHPVGADFRYSAFIEAACLFASRAARTISQTI